MISPLLIALQTTGIHLTRDRILAVGCLEPEATAEIEWFPVPATHNGFATIAKPLLQCVAQRRLLTHHATLTLGLIKQAYKALGYRFHAQCAELSGFTPPSRPFTDAHGSLLALRQWYWHKHDVRLDQASMVLPPRLQTDVHALPDLPGVYCFYGEDRTQPIYIGKSVHIKQRVLSHFSQRFQHPKSLRLFQSVRSIEAHVTEGEFGALLLESQWVKKYRPVFNRKLRKLKRYYRIELSAPTPYLEASIAACATHALLQSQASGYGSFPSLRQAQSVVSHLVKHHQLCDYLMGRERTHRPCFNWQLRRCLGACAGHEDPDTYNQRVHVALQRFTHQQWPYPGALVVMESASAYHVFLHWRYLGTATHRVEIDTVLSGGIEVEEDPDATKLLRQFLKWPGATERTFIHTVKGDEPIDSVVG